MDDNKFENFINNLKDNSVSTHLDLDITWDIPNLLLNSNELLLLMLTKTTMIPFIEDYRAINSDLGLTEEQSVSVQESNIALITLHKMLQQYCIQQFSLGSMMKAEMDNIIISCPEIKDIQSIDNLLNYIENFKTTQLQNGGMDFNKSLLKFLGTLILFTILISSVTPSEIISQQLSESSGVLQLVLNENNVIQPYNKQMIDYSLQSYSQELQKKDYVKSRESTNINNIVVRYDKDIEKRKNQLVTQFLTLFQTQQSGIEFLQEIIDKFNSGLLDFSNGVEIACLDLMDKANGHGVFQHYKDFDSLDETSKKIDDIKESVGKYNSELTEQTIGSTVGTIASSALSIALTGDYSQALQEAVPYMLSLGSSLYDSLTNTKTISEETKKFLTEQQESSTQLTIQQKINLENKIYQFSKLYCSFGYNLQIQLDGTNINVIGDKIEYEWILNVIALLENNIDLKITKSSLNKDLNKFELNALTSLKQRLQVLKGITEKLFEIVNFSIQTHISNLQIAPSADSLEKIETYFNDQLQHLLNMLKLINKQFPKREQKLEEETILFESEKKITEMEDKLELQKVEADNERQQRKNEIIQRVSEMKAQNISASWIATETIAKSYINFAVNATQLTGEGLGKLVKSFGDLGLNIPLGVIESILGFINQTLYLLIINPAGWLLLGSGLLVLTFWFGNIMGVVRIFKKSGEIFITITYGGIMFIYKLIKTPFGFIYRKQDVIAVPEIQHSENEMDAATALLQLKQGSFGGKINMKTRRNKNRLNKKTKRRKNKNTKNKTIKRRRHLNKKKYTRRYKYNI